MPATLATPAAAVPAPYWPADLLEAFTLRMAGHGHPVSTSMMRHDRRYGLAQLAHAHSLADEGLREIAMLLFRRFEEHQSGILQAA